MSDSAGGRPASWVKGRGGYIALTIVWLLLAGSSPISFVASVHLHRDAARSAYTQAHGVRRAARVISEATGEGTHPTSTVAVRLSEPVNGHRTTTVYIRDAPAYSPGAPVTVVVDPQDPGYAELPGDPGNADEQWVLYLVLGLASILTFPLIAGHEFLRQSRRRRRLRMSLLPEDPLLSCP